MGGGALAQPPFRWGGRGGKWEAAKDQFRAGIEAVAGYFLYSAFLSS